MSNRDDGLKTIDISAHERTSAEPDTNFDNFVQNWPFYKHELVLFLGAGASVGAKATATGRALPTAYHLRNALWERFMHSGHHTFDPRDLGMMSLEHAAALVERSVGRGMLVQFLRDLFDLQTPLWQHTLLPFLQPAAIFTTNYDRLIELGYRVHPPATIGNRDCRPYYQDEEPDHSTSIPLYKPHGTIERADQPVGQGGVVLTQFDYIEMLAYRTSALRKCLLPMSRRCVVFLGYSFQDLDIASVLYDMRRANRSVPWYAVFPRNDNTVKAMYDEKYGIRQINKTFLDFMADLDDAVGFVSVPEFKFSNILALKMIQQ